MESNVPLTTAEHRQQPMRIAILDNGLQGSFGHSYTINKALQSELRARKIDHTIFAAHDVEPLTRACIDCVPHFSRMLYDVLPPAKSERQRRKFAAIFNRSVDENSPSETETARTLNRAFAADLERLPADVWAEHDVVLFTGLMQHQLFGFADFVRRRRGTIRAKAVCQLMFTSDWLPWQGQARLGKGLYRKAFRLLRPQINRMVFFTTENSVMSEYFCRHFNIQTTNLPVPLRGTEPSKPRHDRISIGFFGYSKLEKGFQLLPEAIAICLASRRDLDFIVQVQHFGEEPAIVEAHAALQEMEGVELLGHALSDNEYARQTGRADIMLIPYDPNLFGMRGSGIFTESVSAGRPIVASKEIWAGRNIDLGQAAGETFAPYSSAALARAILSLCDSLDEKQGLAREKAAAFAADHSIGAYVDILLEVGGRKTEVARPQSGKMGANPPAPPK